MAITRAQQAKQMLQNGGMSLQDAKDMAPKGEFLAYINRKEADMLKKAGVPFLHYYTMGRSDNIKCIAESVF